MLAERQFAWSCCALAVCKAAAGVFMSEVFADSFSSSVVLRLFCCLPR